MGFGSTRKFITRGTKKKLHRVFSRAPHTRWDMFKNMLDALIRYQRLEVTLPKAKELQQFAEEIVHFAKKDTPESDKIVESMLRTGAARKKLYETLVPRYEHRHFFVTRIIHQWRLRARDAAPMCYIEFVDRPGELKPANPVGMERIKFIHQEMLATRKGFRRHYAEAKKFGLIDEETNELKDPETLKIKSKYEFEEDIIDQVADEELRKAGLSSKVPAPAIGGPTTKKEVLLSPDRALQNIHVDVLPHKYWKNLDQRYGWWRFKKF